MTRRFGQADVQVDVGRVLGAADRGVTDGVAGIDDPRDGEIDRLADPWLEPIEEILARHAEGQPAASRVRCRERSRTSSPGTAGWRPPPIAPAARRGRGSCSGGRPRRTAARRASASGRRCRMRRRGCEPSRRYRCRPSRSTCPSRTAAAEPPLEPPAIVSDRAGWRPAPKADSSLVVPNANSCRLVLPRMITPASRRRLTTGASADAIGAGTLDRARRRRAARRPRDPSR